MQLQRLALILTCLAAINWAFTAVGKNFISILVDKNSAKFYEQMYKKKDFYIPSIAERVLMITFGLAGVFTLYHAL